MVVNPETGNVSFIVLVIFVNPSNEVIYLLGNSGSSQIINRDQPAERPSEFGFGPTNEEILAQRDQIEAQKQIVES